MAAKTLLFTTMLTLATQLAMANPYIQSFHHKHCPSGDELTNYEETISENTCVDTPRVPHSFRTITFDPFPECYIYLYDEPGCSNKANRHLIGKNNQMETRCNNAIKGTKSFKWDCPPVETPPSTAV